MSSPPCGRVRSGGIRKGYRAQGGGTSNFRPESPPPAYGPKNHFSPATIVNSREGKINEILKNIAGRGKTAATHVIQIWAITRIAPTDSILPSLSAWRASFAGVRAAFPTPARRTKDEARIL
jgi:hypothetical protein